MPMVKVSTYVKEMLNEIKEKEEHKSFDSVIRILIYEHWEGEQT